MLRHKVQNTKALRMNPQSYEIRPKSKARAMMAHLHSHALSRMGCIYGWQCIAKTDISRHPQMGRVYNQVYIWIMVCICEIMEVIPRLFRTTFRFNVWLVKRGPDGLLPIAVRKLWPLMLYGMLMVWFSCPRARYPLRSSYPNSLILHPFPAEPSEYAPYPHRILHLVPHFATLCQSCLEIHVTSSWAFCKGLAFTIMNISMRHDETKTCIPTNNMYIIIKNLESFGY
jgi:hypothetical protein